MDGFSDEETTRECETHRFLGILEEDPGTVLDAQVLLTLGSGAVDTRCGLRGVTTHKSWGQRV